MVDFMPIHLPNGSSDGVMVYGLTHYWKWGVPWNVVSGNPLDLRGGPYMFLDDFAIPFPCLPRPEKAFPLHRTVLYQE